MSRKQIHKPIGAHFREAFEIDVLGLTAERKRVGESVRRVGAYSSCPG